MTTTKNLACWVCRSTNTTFWKPRTVDRRLTPEDFQITDSRYGVTLELHRCSDCSFIFADDEEVSELVSLYEQLSDSAYEETSDSRRLQMQWLLDYGGKAHPQARTLLEIGSGSGLLIAEAKKRGLEAIGIEPSRALVEAAKRLNSVDLLQGIFPHPGVEGKQFDLIYVVDVIEHVSDPVGLLASLEKILAPGGAMVVVTPDMASLMARTLKHRWWHLRLAHVGYFSRRSMDKAAERASLRIEKETGTLWFFPIHYLAERLAVYLPIGFINRSAKSIAPLRALYRQVIPLNLGDSSLFLMRRK
jgi:SAM-dependent methyltransferase